MTRGDANLECGVSTPLCGRSVRDCVATFFNLTNETSRKNHVEITPRIEKRSDSASTDRLESGT